ncbi:unnamed protein product [Didymodactylos carnosus]|uniref:DUF5672 domain-containing protein n=1 Tax=Didymodactylos carnosus TaxID=1234261 RepID=A0A814SMU7_9BILA|nr:unnamed protein product [Didymodactylos carnosus]CAF3911673.1 unnamed protein product [Didymodactylos carnosus]
MTAQGSDYLEYDYVGAPWNLSNPRAVGNGGFSLRSRSKTLEVLEIREYAGRGNEDEWYSVYLHDVNAKFAPSSVARTFAVETQYYRQPMAIHKPIYLKPLQTKQLCTMCPEAKHILKDCP